jgi:hypothetical protein
MSKRRKRKSIRTNTVDYERVVMVMITVLLLKVTS